MATYDADKLPPWPQLPEGWDAAAIVPRRSTLSVGAIVFVRTDTRVYARQPGAMHANGGPIERYRYEPRIVAGETRVSWLLAWRADQKDRFDKVPKRDLSAIFGRDDVEDALWIGAHRHKIAKAIDSLRPTRAQLEAVAQILGMEINGGNR